MRFLKYSIIFFQVVSYGFSGTECFESSFKMEVTHKSFPFGLLTKTLNVDKNGCEIKISHNQYKYMSKGWTIDVCRDPIHIKTTVGSVDVYRKVGKCNTIKDEFCNQYRKLKTVIEDDGLIFASGQKNDIKAAHGQTYCTYMLLKEYLEKSIVLNLGHNYDYLLMDMNGKKQSAQADSFKVDPNAGAADF